MKRKSLWALLLLGLIVLAVQHRQRLRLVVTVRTTDPITELYVFHGPEKRWTPSVTEKHEVREAFLPDQTAPVILIYNRNGEKKSWEGSEPVGGGDRIVLTINGDNIDYTRCRWPCNE